MGQPAQQQDVPGLQSKMDPVPDCGEMSYRGSGKLQGKVAVITGADSGIGRAVAIAYAREGADVRHLVPDRGRGRRGDRRPGRDAGRRAVLVPGDVSDPEHCREHRRPCGRRVRAHRRPGQQRRLPDEPRGPRRDQRRGVGAHLRHQRLRDVLPGQGGRAAHAPGLLDHRQLLGQLRHAVARRWRPTRRPRPRSRTSAPAWPSCSGPGDPGEQCRARPDLDAADPVDDAGGEGRALRRGHPARTRGPARRTRAGATSCWPPTRAATCPAPESRSPADGRSSDRSTSGAGRLQLLSVRFVVPGGPRSAPASASRCGRAAARKGTSSVSCGCSGPRRPSRDVQSCRLQCAAEGLRAVLGSPGRPQRKDARYTVVPGGSAGQPVEG